MGIFNNVKNLFFKPSKKFNVNLIKDYGLEIECDGLKILSGISFANLVQLVTHTGNMEIVNLTGNVKISLTRN